LICDNYILHFMSYIFLYNLHPHILFRNFYIWDIKISNIIFFLFSYSICVTQYPISWSNQPLIPDLITMLLTPPPWLLPTITIMRFANTITYYHQHHSIRRIYFYHHFLLLFFIINNHYHHQHPYNYKKNLYYHYHHHHFFFYHIFILLFIKYYKIYYK
jgi:hypothetical protein